MTDSVAEESLHRQAYAQIRRMICSGELAPGTPVMERALGRQLEMSRGPIREALVELEKEDLIRRVGPGIRVVTQVTLNDLVEVYEVREMLESTAARLLATRISDETIAQLRALADKLDGPEHPDADEILFHESIINECGNQLLVRISQAAHAHMRMLQIRDALISRGLLREGWGRDLQVSHGAIVDALERRDPDAAEQAAQTHMRDNRNALLRCIR